MPKTAWQEAREEAKDREYHGEYRIYASDNDPKSLSIAVSNARKAGVGDLIRFDDADALTRSLPDASGILVCNPPYGERMLEQRAAQKLYEQFGRRMKGVSGWQQNIISSEPEFERYYGRKADRKRKLYNGMIQCNYYMYH